VTKDRYDVSGLLENQFEFGSRGKVLRNFLGIKQKDLMDRIESEEQVRAFEEIVGFYGPGHRFKAKDICDIHRLWLRRIYPWAGTYRNVNISKGSFSFAMAAHIPQLMSDFESGALKKYTPCNFRDRKKVVSALAAVHVEIVLIHPFRDGNGRTARLLAVLMALQAGLPPLDFGKVQGKEREVYFSAVRAGMKKDYRPMERVFEGVLERTLRIVEEK